MATVRQPFAPLTSSRLSNLTSLKNRQNAVSSPQPGVKPTMSKPVKRSLQTFEDDDFDAENVDPSLFSKKPKNDSGLAKPSHFILKSTTSASSSIEMSGTSTARAILTPKSPAKISTGFSSTPRTAPAGRSPTRRRMGLGLLGENRRRSATSYRRVDPPFSSLSSSASALPFSLGAALSATAPLSAVATPVVKTHGREEWDFEIYEDSPGEEAANLMEHSTSVLDISSDEESGRKEKGDKGKENVPPVGESSVGAPQGHGQGAEQGAKARIGRRRAEEEIEVDRRVLGEVAIEELYDAGLRTETVLVPADEEEVVEAPAPASVEAPVEVPVEASAEVTVLEDVVEDSNVKEILAAEVEQIMSKTEEAEAAPAALLEPLEAAEEGWTVWESGSVDGDGDA